MRSILDRVQELEHNRKDRHKFEDWQRLTLTSLVDILTILLVYLVKNVSMEVQKVTMPSNMQFPVTMTKGELLGNKGTTLIQIYPDRILVGDKGLEFGTLTEFRTNPEKRLDILRYLKGTAAGIEQLKDEQGNRTTSTALLIQADRSIPCWYITELFKLGTDSDFEYIYFATLVDKDWLNRSQLAKGG